MLHCDSSIWTRHTDFLMITEQDFLSRSQHPFTQRWPVSQTLSVTTFFRHWYATLTSAYVKAGVTQLDFATFDLPLENDLDRIFNPPPHTHTPSVWVAWLRYVTVELVAVDHYMCPWAVGLLSSLLGVCLSLGDVSRRGGPCMGPLFMTVKLTASTSFSCTVEITAPRFW